VSRIVEKKYQSKHKAGRGQGVVEYAGALVIAMAIVAAGIIVVPPNFAAIINTITTNMQNFLMAHLSSL
jgi:hypothetical protein